MKRSHFLRLLGMLALLAAIGCGGPDANPQPSPTPTPTPITGSVKVVNSSSYTIYYAYLSPSNSGSWGPDQLGSHVLLSGGTFTITGVPVGTWDLKAATSGGAVAYAWGFTVYGGQTSTVTVN